jgi:hypothetical protein
MKVVTLKIADFVLALTASALLLPFSLWAQQGSVQGSIQTAAAGVTVPRLNPVFRRGTGSGRHRATGSRWRNLRSLC